MNPEKIFKLSRKENQLCIWKESGKYGGGVTEKSLEINQQESVISVLNYDRFTVIQIKADGNYGESVSWNLDPALLEHFTDQVICDKDNDIRIFILPSNGSKIYMFRPDFGKNKLKKGKTTKIGEMEDKRRELANCITICPLQKILGVTFELCNQMASRIVLFEISGDSLNFLVNFDLSKMKLSGLPHIRILDYWGMIY